LGILLVLNWVEARPHNAVLRSIHRRTKCGRWRLHDIATTNYDHDGPCRRCVA